MPDPEPPRLYAEFAEWWPLLSAPEDYAEEAAFFQQVLEDACGPAARTLLELGSGGGNNASYLKQRFAPTLVDRAPGMVAVSQALNPTCEHVVADMRDVRLGRTFDGVFLHDALAYLTSEADLRAAMRTAYLHCRPGGAALLVPDYLRETFRASTSHGGHDGRARGLRYLEWTWDPDPGDTTFFIDFAYLLRDADGSVRAEQDRHVAGLFARADWLRLLAEVGFVPRSLPFEHSEFEDGPREVFLARRPG